MRVLASLRGFLAIAVVLGTGGAAFAWYDMTTDLAKADGVHVGFVGCIAEPPPERDWTDPALRNQLWRSLAAPNWVLPGDGSKVHRGAAYFLMKTARAEDVEHVVAASRRGKIEARVAATHLAAAWLEDGAYLPESARALLEGGVHDRALAVLALGIYRVDRLDAVCRLAEVGWTIDEIPASLWPEFLGTTLDERARALLAAEADAASLAERHVAEVAELIARRNADELDYDDARMLDRVLADAAFAEWRDATGAADRDGVELAAALPDPETWTPHAFDREALTSLLEYFDSAWF